MKSVDGQGLVGEAIHEIERIYRRLLLTRYTNGGLPGTDSDTSITPRDALLPDHRERRVGIWGSPIMFQWSMKSLCVGQGINGTNQTTKAAVECNDEGTKTRKHYTRTILSDVASVYSFLPLQHTNDGSSLRFSIQSCGVLVPVREKGGVDILSSRRGEVVEKTREDDTPNWL